MCPPEILVQFRLEIMAEWSILINNVLSPYRNQKWPSCAQAYGIITSFKKKLLNIFFFSFYEAAIRKSCKSRNSCNRTTFPYGKIILYNFSVHAEIVHEKFVHYGKVVTQKV